MIVILYMKMHVTYPSILCIFSPVLGGKYRTLQRNPVCLHSITCSPYCSRYISPMRILCILQSTLFQTYISLDRFNRRTFVEPLVKLEGIYIHSALICVISTLNMIRWASLYTSKTWTTLRFDFNTSSPEDQLWVDTALDFVSAMATLCKQGGHRGMVGDLFTNHSETSTCLMKPVHHSPY